VLLCGAHRLVVGICYGTLKQGSKTDNIIPEHKPKKADRARAREAASGTAEEKVSLAADDDDDKGETPEPSPRTNGGVGGRAGALPLRTSVAPSSGDEVHVTVPVALAAELGVGPPIDEGVELDELVAAARGGAAPSRGMLSGELD
jgi:hypothetical protein